MIKKLKKQKYKLDGERISLKIVKPIFKNAEEVFGVVDKNREYLGKWLDWVGGSVKVEDTLKFLFDTEKEMNEGKQRMYGVYLDSEYIGNINFFDINVKDQSAEVGYWLSEEFTGNGYMTEALGVLEKEFFERYGFNRLQVKCDEQNNASAEVAKRLGYKLDGIIRQELYSKSQKSFRNMMLFSKLKSEYGSR